MKKNIPLIRFDWAIKKLLRNKANFDILEGFLSELLQETIKIRQILDSESNKETSNDKHNRVDLLVENTKGELIIIEVQNSKEYDYFHRILFGTSKAITEYIQEGDTYSKIKKVISITIAYFDLGQGKDYIYHGIHQFKGLHHGDILNLADKQKVLYEKEQVYEIFPEYWLIKVSQFNGAVKDKLDEWIYFLKNGEVQDNFTAKGLDAAKVKLDKMSLTDEEQKEYKYYLKRLRDIASEQHTKMADAEDLLKAKEEGLREGFEQGVEEGIEKGIEEGIEKGIEQGIEKGIEKEQQKAILGFYDLGIEVVKIAQALNVTEEKVNQVVKEYR
jgi:predicted transposase/invertase (TIGR01784 family)